MCFSGLSRSHGVYRDVFRCMLMYGCVSEFLSLTSEFLSNICSVVITSCVELFLLLLHVKVYPTLNFLVYAVLLTPFFFVLKYSRAAFCDFLVICEFCMLCFLLLIFLWVCVYGVFDM